MEDGSGRFAFRSLHDRIDIGTASDRYAGWIGQVYSPGRYEDRIRERSRRVGGRSYTERVLPVESASEYFEHFSILEIDFTFYRFLLDEKGKPTETFRALAAYRRFLGDEDGLVLKAPQSVTSRALRRGSSTVENPGYLDGGAFTGRFYEPALSLLGDRLKGIIFEQEYLRAASRPPGGRAAEEFDGFFRKIPSDDRYHLELRTEALLCDDLFQVLERHGVGQVLSHWTWLPSLEEQFSRAGGRVLNSGDMLLVRLLTPRGMRYEESYARAHPFDRIVEGMADDRMMEEAVRIMRDTVAAGRRVTVIVNNRAGGNAPLIAREIARRFRGKKASRKRRP